MGPTPPPSGEKQGGRGTNIFASSSAQAMTNFLKRKPVPSCDEHDERKAKTQEVAAWWMKTSPQPKNSIQAGAAPSSMQRCSPPSPEHTTNAGLSETSSVAPSLGNTASAASCKTSDCVAPGLEDRTSAAHLGTQSDPHSPNDKSNASLSESESVTPSPEHTKSVAHPGTQSVPASPDNKSSATLSQTESVSPSPEHTISTANPTTQNVTPIPEDTTNAAVSKTQSVAPSPEHTTSVAHTESQSPPASPKDKLKTSLSETKSVPSSPKHTANATCHELPSSVLASSEDMTSAAPFESCKSVVTSPEDTASAVPPKPLNSASTSPEDKTSAPQSETQESTISFSALLDFKFECINCREVVTQAENHDTACYYHTQPFQDSGLKPPGSLFWHPCCYDEVCGDKVRGRGCQSGYHTWNEAKVGFKFCPPPERPDGPKRGSRRRRGPWRQGYRSRNTWPEHLRRIAENRKKTLAAQAAKEAEEKAEKARKEAEKERERHFRENPPDEYECVNCRKTVLNRDNVFGSCVCHPGSYWYVLGLKRVETDKDSMWFTGPEEWTCCKKEHPDAPPCFKGLHKHYR